MRVLAALLFLAAAASAQEEWDRLQVHFTLVEGLGFTDMARTEADLGDEWVMLSDCGESASWNGKRYGVPGNEDIVLMYDVNGYIAGVQTIVTLAVADEEFYAFSTNNWYIEGDFFGTPVYYSTSYFVDPETVCTEGRTQDEYDTQGTGYGLYLQSGDTPSDYLLIPNTQEEMEDTLVADGSMYTQLCFDNMGLHYMNFDHTPDQDCNEVIPFQITYDTSGIISAVVHQHFTAGMSGGFWEHPNSLAVDGIVDSGPDCLYAAVSDPGLTTMHIYFRDFHITC